jgi:hypothetical protein
MAHKAKSAANGADALQPLARVHLDPADQKRRFDLREGNAAVCHIWD